MDYLSERTKLTAALDYASGTADREGAVLDMAGFDAVMMIVKFEAIAGSAVTTVKAYYGDESNLSDQEAVTGLSISVADDDDNQIFVLDFQRPQKRYVRVTIDKDTSHATAETALYLQYDPRDRPTVFQVADLVTLDQAAEV